MRWIAEKTRKKMKETRETQKCEREKKRWKILFYRALCQRVRDDQHVFSLFEHVRDISDL